MNRRRSTKRSGSVQPPTRMPAILGRYTPVAAAIFSILHTAHAQDAEPVVGAGGLEEVTVTASKRAENLQDVPIAVTALDSQALDRMQIRSFNDYAQQVPSLSFTSSRPGFAQMTMRGISSGGNSSSGSLPTVGMYLDEQPVTTIAGPIDIHMYDIARVEILPGPQGTLYGASSQAGTVRVITNKPDPTRFASGYNVELNTVKNGTLGGTAKGFVNLPISDKIAARLVGWYEERSGYIDNVYGTLVGSGIEVNNAGWEKDHYNTVDSFGARAALRIDLTENWTVTPSVIAQQTDTEGRFAQNYFNNPMRGSTLTDELSVKEFSPTWSSDQFVDAALTVQGKIGNFDVTYAGGALRRETHSQNDYAEYQAFYDAYSEWWPALNGSYTQGGAKYRMYSNELRISSPQENRVRFVAGLFQQRQQQMFVSNFLWQEVDQPQYTITGWPNTSYLLYQERVNRDSAVFGEVNWDITSKLTFTGGLRRFDYDNSLEGFYGFGPNAYGTSPPPPLTPGGPPGPGGSYNGEQTCLTVEPWREAPCLNLFKEADGRGWTPKYNLSYKLTDRALVYVTYSKGFRPGGVNRVDEAIPYVEDFLTNYEIGWKTSWFDNRLRFNSAIYYGEWEDFQFNFTGSNGIASIANAGSAEVKGMDTQLEWAPTPNLTLMFAGTYADSYLSSNYCGRTLADGTPVTSNPCVVPGRAPFAPLAPTDTQLPGAPKVKTNVSARYGFSWLGHEAYVSGDFMYQTRVWSEMRIRQRDILKRRSPYGLANMSLGMKKDSYSVELFVKNVFDKRASLQRFSDCTITLCGSSSVYDVIVPPRMIGVQFGQRF
jgi:iron complex outermembrane receptor protein